MSLEEVELIQDKDMPSAASASNLLSRNHQPWEMLSFSQGKWLQEVLILQGWPRGVNSPQCSHYLQPVLLPTRGCSGRFRGLIKMGLYSLTTRKISDIPESPALPEDP